MNCIFITGCHGSGKTTVTKMVSQESSLPIINIGERLRELASNDKSIATILKNGDPVPGKVIDAITQDFINNISSDYFIRDGMLMSQDQLDTMNNFVSKNNINFYIIEINISKEIALERLLLRNRNDDTDENITKRLDQYLLTNKYLINKLINIKEHYEINGEQVQEKVFSEVLKTIKNILPY